MPEISGVCLTLKAPSILTSLKYYLLRYRWLFRKVCSSFLKNNGQCQRDNNVNPLFISLRATKFEKRAL